ncbi:MAG TPA: hypothetical protein VJB99_00375 [Patescibacteria group bacterium]|nr:hypothetical protein [Patescibacteria group bacterium]
MQTPLWKNFSLAAFCPLCETRFRPVEARLVAKEDDAHLLHMRCRKCANSVLAVVLSSGSGVSSVGLVTDLSYDDAVRFRRAPRVVAEDVLGAHVWLQSAFWADRLPSLAPVPGENKKTSRKKRSSLRSSQGEKKHALGYHQKSPPGRKA